MPKSRFRISKSARNDPLARPAAAKPAPAPTAAAADDPHSPAFALSLLAKLPLPGTPTAALLPITEAVWTLSALSTHISAKPIRTALLHPDQRLHARLLHAFDPPTYAHEEDADDRLALLTQASGVLRNLCIDAPWGVRDTLARHGLLTRLTAVLQLLIYGHQASPGPDATGPELLQKPADQMNRKEKRHAAKAAAALQAATLAPMNTDHAAPAPAPTVFTPDLLATSAHTLPLLDNILTLLWCLAESASEPLLALIDGAHLHSAILDADRARAHTASTLLADVLLAAVQVALEHAREGPTAAAPLTRSALGLLRHVGAGKPGKSGSASQAGFGLRQLGITAANALCALTDDCPGFVRTLLGIHVDPILPSASADDSASAAAAFDPTPVARALSARRLGDTLTAAVSALELTLQPAAAAATTTPQTHAARTLGVLASAITRNVVHCAASSPARTDELFSRRLKPRAATGALGSDVGPPPAKSKKKKSVGLRVVPGDASEVVGAQEVLAALVREEQVRTVPVLLRLVELEAVSPDAAPTGWVALVQTASAVVAADAAAAAALETRRAQERVQALQLALEVLAELSSAASAVAVAEDAAEERQHAAAAAAAELDGEGDHTMNGDENGEVEMEILDRDGSDEEEEEEEEEAGGDEEGMDTEGANGHAPKNGAPPSSASVSAVPFVFALTSEHKLPSRLLAIAQALLAGHTGAVFPSASSSSSNKQAQSATAAAAPLLRALVSRSLSAAANALLSVASEAPPAASEPEYLTALDWARVSSGGARATKERFVRWADPGVVPGAGEQEVGQGGYAVLVGLWSATWALAAGLAEVPAVVGRPLLPFSSSSSTAATAAGASGSEKEGDEGADGRGCLEACLSSLWAIARAFEPVLGLPRPARPALFSTAAADDKASFRTEPSTSVVPALQAAYLSAHSDAVRVRVLGTLGCVGRIGRWAAAAAAADAFEVDEAELVERNRTVGETLVAVLEALPAEGSSGSMSSKKAAAKKSTSNANGNGPSSSDAQQQQQPLPTTTPECMVAALNAVIDLYADERAVWDVPVFRHGQFLGRLRKLVSRVRAGTRAIDKRAEPGLRARADETAQNYRAFVEFRETVR